MLKQLQSMSYNETVESFTILYLFYLLYHIISFYFIILYISAHT